MAAMIAAKKKSHKTTGALPPTGWSLELSRVATYTVFGGDSENHNEKAGDGLLGGRG